MLANFTGWHFLILLVIVLLLFGATKLPALAKSVGQSMKIFKNEVKSDDKSSDKSSAGTTQSVAAPSTDATQKTETPVAHNDGADSDTR